ncbi:MAG: phosphotransferase [Candidatus Delongbacteria bacterium]|nr:phosphotransferase [Candidatus Delongbacteria bacterium]
MKDILRLCSRSGIKDPQIERIKGDMSLRQIYRINHIHGSLVGVHGENIKENEAFLSFRDSFEESGFNVPKLYSVSADLKTYILEDLGDMTVKAFCDKSAEVGDISSVKEVYRRIIELLPRIQTELYDKTDYSKCYQGDIFDRHAMEKDVSRFEEYFLQKYHKDHDPSKFAAFREGIISEADRQSKDFFMYRDFQTRNIMIKNEELYFIDFQSGRRGSFYYDLSSFIYSSGTINYEGMERELCGVYFNSAKHISSDPEEFEKILKVFACLRIMQAAGNYAFYYFSRDDMTIRSNYSRTISLLRSLSRELGYTSFI